MVWPLLVGCAIHWTFCLGFCYSGRCLMPGWSFDSRDWVDAADVLPAESNLGELRKIWGWPVRMLVGVWKGCIPPWRIDTGFWITETGCEPIGAIILWPRFIWLDFGSATITYDIWGWAGIDVTGICPICCIWPICWGWGKPGIPPSIGITGYSWDGLWGGFIRFWALSLCFPSIFSFSFSFFDLSSHFV